MYIYKTTNLLNNKIYIGQYTGKKTDYLGSGSIFLKAIKKYKKNNFLKEILEYCCSIEELNEREIYWIKYYNATNKSIGYNLSDGGSGSTGYKFTDKQKEKISLSHTGLKQSDETIKKRQSKIKGLKRTKQAKLNISISLKKLYETKDHPRLGKNHTKSTKIIIGLKNAKSLKGRQLSEEHKNNIQHSSKKGEEHYLYGTSHYNEWVIAYGIEEANIRLDNYKKKISKIVLQIDINGIVINEFPSVVEAMKQTGFSRIIDVLKGRKQFTKGYIFKYK